jgi:hypothetical protein
MKTSITRTALSQRYTHQGVRETGGLVAISPSMNPLIGYSSAGNRDYMFDFHTAWVNDSR